MIAEARNQMAAGRAIAGERVDAVPTETVPDTAWAHSLTRADVRNELKQWRLANKLVVGDLG